MNMNYKIISIFVIFIILLFYVDAAVNFGSKGSAIKVADNATLKVSTGMTVTQGTIKKSSSATVTGSSLTFSDGILLTGDAEVNLDGKYDPSQTYNIMLMGTSDFFVSEPGTVAQKISVRGSQNKLVGQPVFSGSTPIKLMDRTTTLTIALHTPLTQNIQLNNGNLDLESDLRLGDDVIITSSGTVNCYGHKVVMGGDALTWSTGTIVWKNVPIIELKSDTTINGRWTFDGTGYILGNGNTLDITSGKLRINSSSTLYLKNLKLKGLGSGTLEFNSQNGRYRLSNVEISMNNDYTFTTGGVYIDGDVKIITGNKYLTFDYGSSLTVDGVTLNYDVLGYTDDNNVRPVSTDDPNQTRITLTSGGVAKNTKTTAASGDVVVTSAELRSVPYRSYIFRDDPSGTYNLNTPPYYFNATNKKLRITADCLIEAGNQPIEFDDTSSSIMIVSAGKFVKFKNTIVNNFSFGNISLGSGSNVFFGENTTVNLKKNETINSTWQFEGDNCVLNGRGKTLTFEASGNFVLRPNTSLRLENIKIKGFSGYQLRCLDNTSTISFDKVELYLDAGYTFSVGMFDVIGEGLSVNNSYTFNYTSNRQSNICAGAKLTLNERTNLKYNPPVALRDRIKLGKTGSSVGMLELIHASLNISTTGWQLTQGELHLVGGCNVYNTGATCDDEGFILGDGTSDNDVTIILDPGAKLNMISGVLVYKNVDSD